MRYMILVVIAFLIVTSTASSSILSSSLSSIYGGTDVETIGGNTKVVNPGDDLQAKYDWLKSSGRDGTMGILSTVKRRTLLLSPGFYSDSAVMDTDYVDIAEIVKGSVSFDQGSGITRPLSLQARVFIGIDITDLYANNIGYRGKPRDPSEAFYFDAADVRVAAIGPDTQAKSQDTTIFRTGIAGTRCTNTFAGTSDMRLQLDISATPWDISKKNLRIRYYIDPATIFETDEQRMAITFFSTLYASHFSRTYLPMAAGWNVVEISGHGAESGTYDPTDVIFIEFGMIGIGVAPENGFFVWDSIEVFDTDASMKPAVCFWFDDGFKTEVELGVRYLQKYSFPSFMAVSTEFIGGSSGGEPIVGESLMREALESDCLVGPHSQTGMLHPNWNKCTDDEIHQWCIQKKYDLMSLGQNFNIGSQCLVMPGGQDDTDILHSISAVDTDNNTFGITSSFDISNSFVSGVSFTVTGSTGGLNDGTYTVAGSAWDGAALTVTVDEAIPSEAVADGTITLADQGISMRSPDDIKSILRKYFTFIRFTANFWQDAPHGYLGDRTAGVSPWFAPRQPQETWFGHGASIGNDTTQFAAYIDKLISRGGIAHIMTHDINTNPTPANFRIMVDKVAAEVAAGNLEVITFVDIMEGR